MGGSLDDSYVAAIQHGKVDFPDHARLVGVVRRPPPWFYAAVDENRRDLGPPDELLSAVKARQQELLTEGMADASAHNRAMEELDYDQRYRRHLQESEAAQTAIDELLEFLADGEAIVLVCFENTQEKRCHRTLLLEHLDELRH